MKLQVFSTWRKIFFYLFLLPAAPSKLGLYPTI